MVLDRIRQLTEVSVAESVVLHGQLLQVLILLQHSDDVFHRLARDVVPADV